MMKTVRWSLLITVVALILSASLAAADGGEYVVQSGDTVSGIAAKYGVDWHVLCAVNKLSNCSIIRVGQRLTIPSGTTASQVSVSAVNTGKLDTTPRLALMSAFGAELEAWKGSVDNRRDIVVNGRLFTTGTLNGVSVVAFQSGGSMTNAAMTTQLALDKFYITHIAFSGIAGGVNPALEVGDVVVPGQWAEYQENLAARELPGGKYQIPSWYKASGSNFGMMHPQGVGITRSGLDKPDAFEWVEWVQADQKMLDVASKVAVSVELNRCTDENVCLTHTPKIKVGGHGVAGPTFVDNKAYREYVWKVWQADSLDMESSAVAHVAYANSTPFVIFRSLSDLAGGGPGENEIGVFFKLAAVNSAKVMLAFVDEWRQSR